MLPIFWPPTRDIVSFDGDFDRVRGIRRIQ